MRTVVVNGKKFGMVPFRGRDVEPGAVIGWLAGRRVYRVLCFDGDEVIARSVRNESILVALPHSEVLDEFGLVVDMAAEGL